MSRPLDHRDHRFKVIEGLLASGHDQAVSVAVVIAISAWPTDMWQRVLTCLAPVLNQDSTQQVTAALFGSHPIMLHPMDPGTKVRDSTKPDYTVRFLSQRSDQNADFEDALQIFVNSVMAQVPKLFSAGGNMWGEPYASPVAPSPRHPGGV